MRDRREGVLTSGLAVPAPAVVQKRVDEVVGVQLLGAATDLHRAPAHPWTLLRPHVQDHFSELLRILLPAPLLNAGQLLL